MITSANRASVILFNLLRLRQDRRPFLLPANICPIVPVLFHKALFPFEFVDISKEDYCIDRELVSDLVRTHQYGGLLFVRTYGCYRNVSSFFRELRNTDEDILIVDDRCLCEPSFEGSMQDADVVLYSTGPRKYVDLGFGGFAFMEEHVPYCHYSLAYSRGALQSIEENYQRCIDRGETFVYVDDDWLDGREPALPFAEYRNKVVSENSRSKSWKSRINNYYRTCFPPDILLGEEWNNWRFCIRVNDKPRLLRDIFSNGLFASSHYSSLVGIFGPGEAPVANSLHKRVVNLFNDRHITVQQVEELIILINKHVRNI